jgi:hypothetical protein
MAVKAVNNTTGPDGLVLILWRGKKKLSIYREQERRTGVRTKTRPLKEGINRIDKKKALRLILYIHSNGP